MECICDMIQFDTVKEAIQETGITIATKNDTSLLLWRDSLSHLITYSKMQPWQIINRIPFSNVLCRKVPLSVILRDCQQIFPTYYDFYPETFILPVEFANFQVKLKQIRENALKEAKIARNDKIRMMKERIKQGNKDYETNENDLFKLIKINSIETRSKSVTFQSTMNSIKRNQSDDHNDTQNNEELIKNDEFIIKPSNGSLGKGIRIIQTGDLIDKDTYCDGFYKKNKKAKQLQAVSQKYIKSCLLNNTKFDLRVYVLVSSVEPFEIFVYRDGLARFCSLKSSCSSIFARITNVTMNKNSSFCNNPEKISRLISDVFDENFSILQQNKIWNEIDDLIVLTLFSSHRYLKSGIEKFLPNFDKKNLFHYSKCFQVFGFDILLRENDLKPFLIEINYRPSLEFMRNCERRMKVDMIKGAIRIAAAPYEPFQSLINSRKSVWNSALWEDEVKSHPELFEKAYEIKKEAIRESKYERIWPFKSCKIKQNPDKFRMFSEILNRIDQIPVNEQLVQI